MKKLLIAFLLTASLCSGMTGDSPFDPGAARANLANVAATASPTMTAITLTDRVTAAFAAIGNASFTGAISGVTTLNGATPLTAAQTASATNLGTMSTQAASAVAITGGVASLSAADIPTLTGVMTINAVVPLTAASQAIALGGSTATAHTAYSYVASSSVKVGPDQVNGSSAAIRSVRSANVASGGGTFTVGAVGGGAGDIYIVAVSISKVARYSMWAGATTEIAESDTTFTNTAGNAGTINVYITGGNLTIQNNTAGATSVNVCYYVLGGS